MLGDVQVPRPRIRRGTVVLAALVSAAGALSVLALPWISALAPVAPGSPARVPVELTGAQCLPAGQPLALVIAAAGVGFLATRAWGVRIVAAITTVSGIALLIMAVHFGITGTDQVLPADSDLIGQTSWWLLAALAGAVATSAGLVAMLVAPRWRHPSAAYQRNDEVSSPEAVSRAVEQPTGASWWDALDRGEDPSADGRSQP